MSSSLRVLNGIWLSWFIPHTGVLLIGSFSSLFSLLAIMASGITSINVVDALSMSIRYEQLILLINRSFRALLSLKPWLIALKGLSSVYCICVGMSHRYPIIRDWDLIDTPSWTLLSTICNGILFGFYGDHNPPSS